MINLRRNIELIEFPVAEIGFLKTLQTLLHNEKFVQQDIISELVIKSVVAKSVSEQKNILHHTCY